ncbi:MAG: Hsp20/alpha crystallin family protein [Bdellovibrionales bacterium]
MVLRSLVSPARYAGRFEDPFLSIQRALQRTLDDSFGGLPSSFTEAASMPVRLDVKEDEKSYTVSADLPGLSEKEVDVTFDDGVLTIRGEKKVSRDEKKDTWHLVERAYGSFARQLSLPVAVKAEDIDAKFDKGVLTIILPKETEPQKSAKKIAIKTN